MLVSAMGVADIEGIQSTGTLAMAKHFAVYGQETDRGGLDDVVSTRALEEIYLPPFKAAVTQAHVSSVMCAYPQLNGTYQCQDPQLLDMLDQWGFAGFVRSDLGSVHDPVAALTSGTDLLKPGSIHQLATLLHQRALPQSAVDSAATQVLTQMFAHGLVGRVGVGSPGALVDSESHTDFALLAAERSAVLLKDSGSVLPLDPSRNRSVAVIGADASTAPVTTGFGSSKVTAPFVSTPLDAIRRRAGGGVAVSYTDGGSTTGALAPVPTALLTPASGQGHGLTLTLTQTDPDTGPPTLPDRRAHRRCRHQPPPDHPAAAGEPDPSPERWAPSATSPRSSASHCRWAVRSSPPAPTSCFRPDGPMSSPHGPDRSRLPGAASTPSRSKEPEGPA